MYRQFCLALLILIPVISFSQEEKGCGIFSNFTVDCGQTPSGSVNRILHCNGSYTVYCTVDSVFIDLDLDLDEDLVMKWSFRNELSTGTPYLTEELVEWYRNDSLIDSNLYVVDDYITTGPCGPQRKAEATLETRVLGAYQLRKTFWDNPLAVIVLREKAASIEVVDEVSLNIYPNPTSDVLYIEHGEINNSDVVLHSIDGKIVVHPMLISSGGITEIDISQLPSGSYILTFTSDQHHTVRKKINII